MTDENKLDDPSENASEQASDDSQELTTSQLKFVHAMLENNTIREAAQHAKISERTAYRYLNTPLVKDAIDTARTEIFETSMSEMKHAVKQAVRTLKRHLNNDETPPNAQIRAAQIIIEQTIELQKISTLEKQIADIEAKIRGINEQHR